MMTLRQKVRDEAQPPDHAGDDDIVIEPDQGARARELHEFVRRCRELLARRGPKDCPPGHWLG